MNIIRLNWPFSLLETSFPTISRSSEVASSPGSLFGVDYFNMFLTVAAVVL
jgi:hypothetical protein